MAAALEWRLEPDAHKVEGGLEGHHALAERNHVGVVMLAREPRGFDVPAQRTTNSFDSIGDHRLAIAGAAQHDAALRVPSGHCLRHGPDKQGIIDRLLGMGPEILHTMFEAREK